MSGLRPDFSRALPSVYCLMSIEEKRKNFKNNLINVLVWALIAYGLICVMTRRAFLFERILSVSPHLTRWVTGRKGVLAGVRYTFLGSALLFCLWEGVPEYLRLIVVPILVVLGFATFVL